jgi:hypothetical protein
MKKLYFLCLIVLLSGFSIVDIHAQQWVTYNIANTSNGLSHNTVYDIAIDGSGNKWFACYYGVSKYDGTTWTKYNTTNTSNGLAGNLVYCVTVDGSGNKWFGTDGGVSKLSGSTWTKYTTADGLVNNEVHAIAIDGSGNMWFGTSGGVSKFTGSAWTNYKTTEGLANNLVQSIAVEGTNIWLGCYGGVSKFNGIAFTNYYQGVNGPVGFSVNAVAIDGSGNKLFGTDLGVSVYNGSSWTSYTTLNGLAGNDVRAIEIEAGGRIWFGTTAGVTTLNGNAWTTYTSADGLTNDWVNTIALAPAGVVWFGCDMNGVSKFTPPYLTLSSTTISINAAADSKGYVDISSNTSWTLVSDQTWLTSNKSSATGNFYVTLTAGENPTTSTRGATVTVTATGLAPKTITVTQAASAPKLEVETASITLNADQNSAAYVNILSNIPWTASSNQGWCTVAPTGATGSLLITVSASANYSAAQRTATVTFSGSGVSSKTLEVIQSAAVPSLSVSPSSLNPGSEAGSTNFGVTSTVSWTVISNQSWLTVVTGSGSGNGTVSLNFTKNDLNATRTATVTVSAPGVSDKTVAVTQSGQPFINVSTNALTIDAALNAPSSTTTFGISSNSHWEASWSDLWFNLSANQGDGNLTVTVTAEPNFSNSVRTGYIYLRLGNSSTPVIQTITLTQGEGPYFALTPTALTLTGEAGSTASFFITTNASWTVSSAYGTVSIDKTSGTGVEMVTITSLFSNTESPRTEIITVHTATNANISGSINVTQDVVPVVFNVSPAALNVGSAANSTASFLIAANIGWAVSANQSWLHSNIGSASGNWTVVLTADANPFDTEQTAIVTITGANSATKTVTITQAAAVLIMEASATTINVPADDNYQTTFNITSNVEWGVASDSPWLSASPSYYSGGNSVVTVTTSGNYTGEVRTGKLTVWSPSLGYNRFINVIQSITTGIEDFSQGRITIYPNPAHDFLNIDVPANEIMVTVSDINGRKIKSEKLSGTQKDINISKLPKGIYFIEITEGLKKNVLRFVKD